MRNQMVNYSLFHKGLISYRWLLLGWFMYLLPLSVHLCLHLLRIRKCFILMVTPKFFFPFITAVWELHFLVIHSVDKIISMHITVIIFKTCCSCEGHFIGCSAAWRWRTYRELCVLLYVHRFFPLINYNYTLLICNLHYKMSYFSKEMSICFNARKVKIQQGSNIHALKRTNPISVLSFPLAANWPLIGQIFYLHTSYCSMQNASYERL